MLKTKQELYDRIYASIGGDNVTEEYQLLLDLISGFSEDDKTEIDFDKIGRDLLYHLSMNELDLEFAYKYDKKLNLNLREKINEVATTKGNAKTIASYIGLNNLDDEEIISLAIKAIKKTLPEIEEEIETIVALKRYLEEKNLYFDTISAIKSSKDPETLVCAALLFEPNLIKEVFGGKKNMYLYLTVNTFTDFEDIEYYKERLLSMDNNQLNKQLNRQAQKIDRKIKQKKV